MIELTFNAYEIATIAHLGQKYGDEPYIRRLSKNPIAKRVKIADLQENLSQGDLSLSTRYYKALKMLEE